ncbi:alpha/beta hydrolase [Rhodococcus sp. X156]|uniref:alpha/beta hydrolase n=1 Tax=Rhodococcus sp. X156 TaxID=2499145 RepID=UPI000FDC9984|nr:alpha/beta hydrolase [Rhodococcus sp. X156]
MALDAATTDFIGLMAQAGGPPLHELSPAEARTKLAGLVPMFGTGPDVAEARTEQVPGPGGDLAVRVLVPHGRPRGVLVYFHGGGWVLGSLPEYEVLGRQLAARTGCTVAVVDYRLAPEHPYPAAVGDAWAALQWASATLASAGSGPAGLPLVVAGDSAGGNLAAIVSRHARDAGGPDVALQVLVYPVTDCDLESESYVDPANQGMLNRHTMAWFWNHYVTDEQRTHPDVSPLRAADLAGLAPAVVVTAEHDVLRTEGEAYASALAEAGVDVTHRRFDGQMHGFFTMVNLLPGSATAIDFVAEQVGAHLDQAGTAPTPESTGAQH